MYRALLFDLDDTLAETDPLHLPTWIDVLQPYSIEVNEEFYRARISGRSNSKIVEDLLPDLSTEEGQKLADAKEASSRERAHELEPLPGLLDFIKEGKSRDLSLALVTNAPEENVDAILLALELREFFDEVVLSEKVGPVKPDPAPYKTALDKLGISPEEALAFEDSTSGIASTQTPERLKEAGAFMVARDFTDPQLRKFLNG